MNIVAHADSTINQEWLAAYRALQRRHPHEDALVLMDAASQVVADEVDAKPGIGFDEMDPEVAHSSATDEELDGMYAAILGVSHV